MNTIGIVDVAALAAKTDGVARDNDGRRTADKLSRQQRQTIVLALRPLFFDYDILALDKAGVSQAFTETGQRSCRGCGRGSTEHSNDRECRLLRARRKRPRSRTTQNAEEIASPHGRHQVRELAAYRLSPVFDRAETGLTVDPSGRQMSELGQNRKCRRLHGMSVLPPRADIVWTPRDVRKVPNPDIRLDSDERPGMTQGC